MEQPSETFLSHLIELRTRVIRACVAIIVVFVCLMPWANTIFDMLARPMLAALPQGSQMIAVGVITPFMVPVKVTLLVAFVLALPVVLYQIWAFVAPGLYAHERKFVLPTVMISTLLFITGMAFCYFFVFQTVFKFIAGFKSHAVQFAPDIEMYTSFVMTMFLAFGITFEVPVVVVLLVKTGLVSVEQLKKARGYVIVLAFVIAAIVTPPDVTSQIMLAVPMCLLYEVGLVMSRFVSRRAPSTEVEKA